MTKRNSTGGQATPVGKTTNHFIGYTTKKPANIRGYYNDDVERLFLFWDTTDKSGKSVIESSTILANSLKFNRRTNLNSCTSKTDISSATPSFIPGTGHMLVWQEKVNGKWRLGGSLLKRNAFTATNREQKSPVTFYNPVKRNIFVIWIEEENGQSYIGTQHIKPSSSYSCSPACKKGLFCRWLDTCRPNQNGKSCLFNNGGCSDVCLQDGNNVLCSCPIGLSLEQDRRTCKKLAPCNGQNPIKDLTGNNINCDRGRGRGRGGGGSNCPKDSYCHVHPADQFAVCCPVVKPDLTMLIASEDSIWQITVISQQNKIAFTKLPFTTTKIVAVDYDPVEQYVYWTDVATGRIHKARYGKIDAVVETVVGGFLVPDGLVLDTSERTIYWTDGGKDQIGVVNMDGSGLKVLVNQQLDQPRALALHKTKRLMYWSDWGATPKIERSNLEGENRRVIVNSLLGWPNGLVVDEKYQKLYFADALLDKIESCDLDGNGRQLITSQSPHPFSLAILNDKLYWSDWNYGGILSVDKSSTVDTLAQGLLQPKDICIIEAIPLQQDFDCMDTGVPLNGGRNPKPSSSGTYKTNTKVHFTCNPGYVHIGPSSLVCRPSGQWSDTTPRCKALPVISVGLFNQTVESGKSVVLKCILSGGKRRWLKDGTEMSNFQVGHHFISPINGYLVLERVHQVDSGIYTCQGYNDAGTVQSDAYLYVQGSTYKDCGQPKFSTRGRIIGGRIAGHGAHPWQVLVILGNKSNRKGFCGGTLISPKWVVTAAHCLRGLSPNRVQVKLGKHRRTKVEATEQVSEVDKIELNNFNDQTYDSDIALLHLAGNITFTDYIKPVCLPLKESDMSLLAPNVTALISGWGSKKAYDLKGSYRLREVAVPIVTQQQCIDAHPTYIVTQNMFCAGHSEGSKGDACQGDSGGPLVIKNTKTNRWVLFGVISWGDRCGIDGKYGVYTKLPNFIDWILSITQI